MTTFYYYLYMFRATLILLPLLGLHYVVMPFRPEAGAPGEIAYQVVSAVFTSFQVRFYLKKSIDPSATIWLV